MTNKTEALEALDRCIYGTGEADTEDGDRALVRHNIEAQAAEIERMEAEKREAMELLQRARAG